MTPIVTYIIIGITVLVSYKAFNDGSLKWRFMFNPYQVKHRKEWYRLFSSGLIHADWMHLGLNMYVLYMFGEIIEPKFRNEFGEVKGTINFILLYLGGLLVSSLYNLAKHQDNANYNALGASGAVSGIVFSFIAFYPLQGMGIILIPIHIPAIIFGGLYLAYSQYMAKKQIDNIGHDAHFWGAVFGFVVTFIFKPDLFRDFLNEIISI